MKYKKAKKISIIFLIFLFTIEIFLININQREVKATIPPGQLIGNVKAVYGGPKGCMMYLLEDGKLFAGGTPVGTGQLGTFTTGTLAATERVNLTNVAGNVAKVEFGHKYSILLDDLGYIYATGINDSGQLGMGNTTNLTIFTQIPLPQGVVIKDISAGARTAYALSSNGDLYAWGYGGNGEFGDTTAGGVHSTPIIIASGVIQITSSKSDGNYLSDSYNAIYIVKNDGNLYVSGSNDYGQLGLGSSSTYITAFTNVPMFNGLGIKQIQAGSATAFVLLNDGTAYACGENEFGPLGVNASSTPGITAALNTGTGNVKTWAPMVIPNGYRIEKFFRCSTSQLYQLSDGHVWGSGSNDAGDLGFYSENNVWNPGATRDKYLMINICTLEQVDFNGNLVTLAPTLGGGGTAAQNHTDLAIYNNGSIKDLNGSLNESFMVDSAGYLRVTSDVADADTSAVMYAADKAINPSTRQFHRMQTSRRSIMDPEITISGYNSTSTVLISGINKAIPINPTTITMGPQQSDTADVYMKYIIYKYAPSKDSRGAAVITSTTSDPAHLVTAGPLILDVGALINNKTLLNGYYLIEIYRTSTIPTGETGAGTALESNHITRAFKVTQIDKGADAPTYGVISKGKFVDFGTGYLGGLALDDYGVVWTWGWNQHGQLGSGQMYAINSSNATYQGYAGGMMKVKYFLANNIHIVSVQASYHTFFALDNQGNVYAWGYNGEGQVGIAGYDTNSGSGRNLPNKVTGLPKIVKIKASNGPLVGGNGMALDENGGLWIWGSNANGKHGVNNTTNTNAYEIVPHQAIFPAGVKIVDFAGGDTHNLALDSNGDIWAWGSQSGGVLGNGVNTTTSLNVPTKINPVPGMGRIVDISISYSANLALDEYNQVWQWGQIFVNTAAPATAIQYLSPVLVEVDPAEIASVGYVPIPQRVFAGQRVYYFVDQHGRSWAWGYNVSYGLGREGGYETSNDILLVKAQQYPKVIGDGDTQIYDTDHKTPADGITKGTWKGYGFNAAHPTIYDEKYNDPKEDYWKNLAFKPIPKIKEIHSNSAYHGILDVDGNMFRWGVDGSGSLAWGWDYNSTYDSTGNLKDGLYDKYAYEVMYMRGLDVASFTGEIKVTDSNGNGTAEPGEILRYTINYTNIGSALAENVIIRDLLDDTEFNGAIVSNLKVNGVLDAGDIRIGINVGNIALNQTVTITFDVQLPTSFGDTDRKIVNTVTLGEYGFIGSKNPIVSSIPVSLGTKVTIIGDVDTIVILTEGSSGKQYIGILEAGKDLIFKNLYYGTYNVSCVNQFDVDFIGTDIIDNQFTLSIENLEATITLVNEQTAKPGFYDIVQEKFMCDTIAPTIIVSPNTVTIPLGSEYDILEGVTATDSVDGDITSKINAVTDLNINQIGTYTVTYTVSNAAGNMATAKRTIIVKVAPEPVIMVNPIEVTITKGIDYNVFDGVSATDEIDGDITASIEIGTDQVLDLGTVGTYTVTYTVTNSSGITRTNTRTIIVVPAAAVITVMPEIISIMGGFSFDVLLGVTAVDDIDGDITSQIIVQSDLDINTLGNYTVTYTVTNTSGITTVATRTIIVTDVPTPPLLLDGNKNKQPFLDQLPNDNTAKNVYLLALVIAIDYRGNDISSDIIVTSDGGFDPSKVGDYKIYYEVTDDLGKTSTLGLTVTVWNFVKIVSDLYHSLALGSNGSVWSWGYNNAGQRGLGNTTTGSTYRLPTRIPQNYFGNLLVTDIAIGYASSFALNSAGQAYSWGYGANYQLGNGSTTNQTRPVPITQPAGVKFKQISSFYETGAGLGNDGNIYTWGYGGYGAAGTVSTSTVTTPKAITTSGDFVQISQGYYGGAAVNSIGQVYTWGYNSYGQRGVGTTGGTNYVPALVPSLSNIKKVSYGQNHVLALTNDGHVYAWGYNSSGRLGLGDTTNRSTPTLISSLSSYNVSQINAAMDFSQFKVGNDIYSCGYANYGELFGGNTTSRNVPYISSLTNIAGNVGYMSGRGDNAFILSVDGKMVYGIGYCDSTGQEFGSINIQATSNAVPVPWSFVPPPIPSPPKIIDANKNKDPFIDQIANNSIAKNNYLLGLVSASDSDGNDLSKNIVVTDDGGFDPSTLGKYVVTYRVADKNNNKATFELTVTVWNFVRIVNGQYHSLALGSNGSVWSWGNNDVGQRGIGNTTAASSYRAPTQIPQSYFGNLPVIDISAGSSSCLVLNSAGQAYAWGDGSNYQLGNGAISNQNRPVPVTQPSGIKFKQISIFNQTGVGLGNDGNIYTWGSGTNGAAGTGTTSNVINPTAITTSGDFVQISQGDSGGAAVNSIGKVYTWGYNLYGEKGDGTTGGTNYAPFMVPSLSNIKEVSRGGNHVLALTNDGHVYAWGYNNSGRLGLGDTTNRPTPTLISGFSGVIQINAAYDFSQFRVGNDIYSCGNSNYGESFAGNITDYTAPNLSTMTNIAGNVGYIAGRYDNAFILSVDGKTVYGIGYCISSRQEFGSTTVQASSTTAAVPWTFIPQAAP